MGVPLPPRKPSATEGLDLRADLLNRGHHALALADVECLPEGCDSFVVPSRSAGRPRPGSRRRSERLSQKSDRSAIATASSAMATASSARPSRASSFARIPRPRTTFTRSSDAPSSSDYADHLGCLGEAALLVEHVGEVRRLCGAVPVLSDRLEYLHPPTEEAFGGLEVAGEDLESGGVLGDTTEPESSGPGREGSPPLVAADLRPSSNRPSCACAASPHDVGDGPDEPIVGQPRRGSPHTAGSPPRAEPSPGMPQPSAISPLPGAWRDPRPAVHGRPRARKRSPHPRRGTTSGPPRS